MKIVRNLFDGLKRTRILRPVKPVIETLEGIVLGSPETAGQAPHFRDHIEIKRYMSTVILAMIPMLFALIRKKEIEEGFLVTGLIFPLILPPTAPLWVVAVGIAFGVFFGKEVFGGTGRNIFNPALVGRIFITIAFPEIMSAAWRLPFSDAITAATPLAVYKSTQGIAPYWDLLLGRVAGSTGEVFRIGIIAGAVLLMMTRVSSWRITFSYLATVALFAFVGHLLGPGTFAPPLFQLLAGSVLFGAVFMATDPVTSPATKPGKFIFGTGCGIVTVLIRTFSGFTEGVMFSIVIMNAFTPLIDNAVVNITYRPAKR